MATTSTVVNGSARNGTRYMSVAYLGLVLYVFVYYGRPSEWFSFLRAVPFAKVAAVIAVSGFVMSALQGRYEKLRLPLEMIYLLLLYGQLLLTVPFAIWIGGSFEIVVTEFWKVVLMALLVSWTVTSLARLRWLLSVTGVSVGLIVMMTLLRGNVRGTYYERLSGLKGGLFGNPNDLALLIVVALPLYLAFLLQAKNVFMKAIWATILGAMSYALLQTYSRSGIIAMAPAAAIILWEYGVKGRRYYLPVLAGIAVVGFFLAFSPENYMDRVASIVVWQEDRTNSAWARKHLLNESVQVTLEHPLVGVGPGNFTLLSGTWAVTHNTYTELSSEAGIPALILYLLFLGRAFFNLNQAKKVAQGDREMTLLGGALNGSLAGFMVGAFFSSAAYHVYPYLLVGAASAFAYIANKKAASQSPAEAPNGARVSQRHWRWEGTQNGLPRRLSRRFGIGGQS